MVFVGDVNDIKFVVGASTLQWSCLALFTHLVDPSQAPCPWKLLATSLS